MPRCKLFPFLGRIIRRKTSQLITADCPVYKRKCICSSTFHGKIHVTWNVFVNLHKPNRQRSSLFSYLLISGVTSILWASGPPEPSVTDNERRAGQKRKTIPLAAGTANVTREDAMEEERGRTSTLRLVRTEERTNICWSLFDE